MKKIIKNTVILIVSISLTLALTLTGTAVWTIDVDPMETTVLTAIDANLIGSEIRFEQESDNLGYWAPGNMAVWDINVKKDGRYKVVIEYARPHIESTITAVIEVGDRTIKCDLETTGDWQYYNKTEIGVIEIKTSDKELLMTDDMSMDHFLNLKNIYLIPFQDGPIIVNGEDKVTLMAADAILSGRDIELKDPMSGNPYIGNWTSGNSASWDINVETAGTYKVSVNYARALTQATLPLEISTKVQTFTFGLKETGTWSAYKDLELGEIHVLLDDTQLTLTPGSALNAGINLMNLRYITLELVKADSAAKILLNAGTEICILVLAGVSLIYAGLGAAKRKSKSQNQE